MRAIGLPEQYGNTLHCMLSPAIKPRKGSELSYAMKPDFPFNLSLTALIESYMCKVHKTLKDLTGNGLPLDAYLQDLKKLFRDRSRNLPPKFCARPTHQGLNCETWNTLSNRIVLALNLLRSLPNTMRLREATVLLLFAQDIHNSSQNGFISLRFRKIVFLANLIQNYRCTGV